MACERTLSLLGTIHAKRNCHVNRCCGIGTAHGAGSIHNSHAIEGSLVEVIGQIIPILIHHQTSGIVQRSIRTRITPAITSVHGLHSLSNALVRIESLGIDLLGLILCEVGVRLNSKILLHTLNVMTSKGVLIDHASARGDLIELNLVPTVLRHQTLDNIDASTQGRESLTILLMGHTKSNTSNISQLAGLGRAGILRLQPLSEQRRSLAGKVQSELVLHERQSVLLQRSANKEVEVVPTTELRDMLQIAASGISVLLSQPLHSDLEEATLTLAAANIADIKQALQSINGILCECLLEHQDNILVGARTICSAHSKHIEQIALSSLMGNSTILGES